MSARTLSMVILALSIPLCAAEESPDSNPLLLPTVHPASSGLLVIQIVPNSTAAKAGLRLGDLVSSYDGMPLKSVDQLQKLIAASSGPDHQVVLESQGKQVTKAVAQGRLGIGCLQAEAGKAIDLVPAATPTPLDARVIDGKPAEQWYVFSIDGKEVGFDHETVTKGADGIHILSEVAFDMGGKFGLQHSHQEEVFRLEQRPVPVRSTHRDVRNEILSQGEVTGQPAHLQWSVTVTAPDGVTHESTDIHPDYLQDGAASVLGLFMPHQLGACIQFRSLLPETAAPLGHVSAVAYKGDETIQVQGKNVNAARFDGWQLGSVVRSAWVADGIIVQQQWGATSFSRISTKEEALAHVPKDATVRGAKPITEK
jgi:hypothetical protein